MGQECDPNFFVMSSSNPTTTKPSTKKRKSQDDPIHIPQSSGWSKDEYLKDLEMIPRPNNTMARPIPTKPLKIGDYDLSQKKRLVPLHGHKAKAGRWEIDHDTNEGISY